jgi:hypothetical protein
MTETFPFTGIEYPFSAKYALFNTIYVDTERLYTVDNDNPKNVGIPRRGPCSMAAVAIEMRKKADIK